MIYAVPLSWWVLGLVGVAGLVLGALLLVGRVPLGYTVRNLVVRWRITVVTALAFTAVVGLLTVLLAFVNGMYRLTQGSGQPGNVLVLSDGATDELMSNLSHSDTGDVERQPGVLTIKDAKGNDQALCSREVYMIVTQPIANYPGERERRRFVQVRGIVDPEIAGAVHGLTLLEGQWFSDAGVQDLPGGAAGGSDQAIQCVIGESAARELGKDVGKYRLEVGDIFDLGPRQWAIVGVMKSGGSTFDSEIWGKQQILGPLFGKDRYTSLVLRTADAESAEALAKYLSKDFKKAALAAQPESKYYQSLQTTNQQFLVAILVVAAVMAIGGVFGVMNTMFAAISARTKDIGVMRILGFTGPQILVAFFLEGLTIALVGGLLGCALGYLCNGWTASSIISSGQGGGGKTIVLELTVDSLVLAVGVLFSLFTGTLGGLLPAWTAMRLKPLEALR
jgi:ABC-type lipoprotein release transport system permease subunit